MGDAGTVIRGGVREVLRAGAAGLSQRLAVSQGTQHSSEATTIDNLSVR